MERYVTLEKFWNFTQTHNIDVEFEKLITYSHALKKNIIFISDLEKYVYLRKKVLHQRERDLKYRANLAIAKNSRELDKIYHIVERLVVKLDRMEKMETF